MNEDSLDNILRRCRRSDTTTYYIYKGGCKSHILHIINKKREVDSSMLGPDLDTIIQAQSKIISEKIERDSVRGMDRENREEEPVSIEDLL